jgi:hypothetical protein
MLTTTPKSWLQLIFFAAFASILIRIVNSFFRSKESTDPKTFCNVFCGKDDLWLPFFIGALGGGPKNLDNMLSSKSA